MPSITYLRDAADCPQFMVPSGYLDPLADPPAPVVAELLRNGDKSVGTQKINRNAVRLDCLGRYGGGGYAVAQGLGLADGGGLTLALADPADPAKGGAVVLDGAVVFPAPLAAALPDNVNGSDWIAVWVTRAGNVTLKTDNTPPALPAAFLGAVQTTSGAITAIDYSNRLEFRGGVLYRRTADAGAPGDTPPTTAGFLHQTAGGVYFWLGFGYVGSLDAFTVYADGSDTAPGTLAGKTKAGTGITLSVVVDGGVRKLKIDAAGVPTTAFQLLAADPGSPADGDVWYNTTTHRFKGYQNGGVVTFNDWASLTGKPATFAPAAHAAAHEPGGTDALDWTGIIHPAGTHAARPAAGAVNAGSLYLETDTNGGTLFRSDGASWAPCAGPVIPAVGSTPVYVALWTPGQPAVGEKSLKFVAADATGFPANFAGSVGSVEANPAATAVYAVQKNGSSVGTITLSTGGAVTFSTSGLPVTLAAGDELALIAPSPQDATLQGIALTLKGAA